MKSEKSGVDWNAIFKNLERWQKKIVSPPEEVSSPGEQLPGDLPAVSAIAAEHGNGPDKPWAVLVSTILSLRTKDDVTRASSRRLLEKAPNPEALLALGVEETARLAYPAGFYRTKAASLVKIAAILLQQYGGQVPADMDALLDLPGVGRKTANLVITEAFDMYGICVDVHVHRICNRAGWISTPNPKKTEAALREGLPKRYWKRINGLLVHYGQIVCRPLSPYCSRCVIGDHCLRLGVERSR